MRAKKLAGLMWFGKIIVVSLRLHAGATLAKLPGPILLSASILIVLAVSNYEAGAQSKLDNAPPSATGYSRGYEDGYREGLRAAKAAPKAPDQTGFDIKSQEAQQSGSDKVTAPLPAQQSSDSTPS